MLFLSRGTASSTRIRGVSAFGNIAEAEACWGILSGRREAVVSGQETGPSAGIPHGEPPS